MNYYYRYNFYVIQGGKKIWFNLCGNKLSKKSMDSD